MVTMPPSTNPRKIRRKGTVRIKKDGRFFILHIFRVALEAFYLGFMGGDVSLFLQI